MHWLHLLMALAIYLPGVAACEVDVATDKPFQLEGEARLLGQIDINGLDPLEAVADALNGQSTSCELGGMWMSQWIESNTVVGFTICDVGPAADDCFNGIPACGVYLHPTVHSDGEWSWCLGNTSSGCPR